MASHLYFSLREMQVFVLFSVASKCLSGEALHTETFQIMLINKWLMRDREIKAQQLTVIAAQS